MKKIQFYYENKFQFIEIFLMALMGHHRIVGFTPLIPYPLTEYTTVYTALKNFQDIRRQLNQSHLLITSDEGVYRIAWEIMLMRPEECLKISSFPGCMGSFHLAKFLLGCLGKCLRCSGTENIWIENLVFGVNVVVSACGTHYTCSLKGMLLLCEAMQRFQLCEFFKVYGCEKYQQQFSLLKELKASIAKKKKEN